MAQGDIAKGEKKNAVDEAKEAKDAKQKKEDKKKEDEMVGLAIDFFSVHTSVGASQRGSFCERLYLAYNLYQEMFVPLVSKESVLEH